MVNEKCGRVKYRMLFADTLYVYIYILHRIMSFMRVNKLTNYKFLN